ncbi:Alpha/Beta hydrolase protein [Ilyonectria destructans]|nr:Alpha/Beta hydrolase protein [Ilyonectria destructans]
MDFLVQKQLINSRSLQYAYYASAPSNETAAFDQPALLLLHGFPETSGTWAALIPYLLTLGLRILVPDLLGYGGTSKPWDVSSFSVDAMTSDLAEILTFENVSRVIPIGHDWGSYLAHRYYLYYPEQVDAVVMSSFYYEPPIREPINVTQIAEEREGLVGFPLGWYYPFLASSEAAPLISGHIESFLSAGYGDAGAMKETFGYKDSLRNWLLGDKRRPLLEFTTRDPNMLKTVEEAFGGDGLVSPLMWYRAYVNGTQYKAEKKLPAAADKVEVPLLHISGKNDPLGPAALFETQEAKTAVPDLTNVELDSTHFMPVEKPMEMAETIIKWLESKNLTSARGTKGN